MTDDDKYYREVYRVMQLARTHSGDDLLEKCLDGRQRTAKSVSQLFRLARLHFVSGDVQERICEACLPFLESNMSSEELHKLKNPDPSNGGILDEMAAEMATERRS